MKFSSHILQWYNKSHRNLPWRTSKEPYKVWLSEIILQQTRVAQGLSYYYNFTDTFPTIKHLAEASEEEVLKLWQGLGYYSRARNLHTTAKHIQFNLNGKFPNNYKDLLKLKGVGPYTAAAISSICFNEQKAAVDGNVYRVLARVFNVHTPINSTKGIKEFQLLADTLINKTEPGNYNQGMMELGALICTPKNPVCNNCPIHSICIASRENLIDKLPLKERKIKVKERHLNYYCIEHKEQFLMNKRLKNDIWKNLYDFPHTETSIAKDVNSPNHHSNIISLIGNNTYTIQKYREYKHKLSHQNLNITIHHITTNETPAKNNYTKVNYTNSLKLPVPKPIERFFHELFDSKAFDNDI